MQAVIDRDYCIQNPAKIVRFFGLGIFFQMLLSNKKTLLERLTEKYLSSGISMPGPVGNAYKLSALIEFRIAKIYEAMAERFKDNLLVHELFVELSEEELEHGRIMLVCLFEIVMKKEIHFVPEILDPEIRKLLSQLRLIQHKVNEMSVEDALQTTKELEQSEVNVIFGKLLQQVGKPKLDIFSKQLEGAKNHSESVPRRIIEIKAKMANG
jgi:hypothetical protein